MRKNMNTHAYIVDAQRTAIGKFKGALKYTRPDDLIAAILATLVKRQNIESKLIDEVILGCANQAGEDNRNIARMATLLAGFDNTVPAVTVNRLCGSGMDAIMQAARIIQLEEADLIIAGGVESMTRAPWSVPKPIDGFVLESLHGYDTSLGWRYKNPRLEERFPLESMGETAENVREKMHISRHDQDEFAAWSHEKALQAQKKGYFKAEITPLDVVQSPKGNTILFDTDEGPREDSHLSKLSTLKPVFRTGGTVTAGNSSSLNDGACALLLASKQAINRYQLKPLAKIVAYATTGLEPQLMGLGPIEASQKALKKAQLSIQDIDLFEINEAFAAQAIACQRTLGVDAKKLNIFGGAIALGHPLGASGARICTTLAYALKEKQKRYGLASMCIGVGQGIAMIVEHIDHV